MEIFNKLKENLFGPNKSGRAFAGPLGDMLAKMGIHDFGTHLQSGTPNSVLAGCKKAYVTIPKTERPLFTKDGKPLLTKDKKGRVYQVHGSYALPKKLWKSMQNDQKRKAEGRWYSGKPA